jgi:hypothetical protein
MLTTADRVGFPHRREITAIVLAIVPFILNFYSISTVNGRVTSYSDFADVILGAALVLVTLRNTIFIREGEAKYKTIRIVLTAVLLLVAAFHIASGLGLLVSLPAPFGYGS